MATRSLSLCAGIGGIDLGLSLEIPDYQTVCFVEWDTYCAATLMARMEDKTLDSAPIWDDLTTFDGTAWRGCVDLITAGFPCQPFSSAGAQRGTDDERWLWPAISTIISDVGPRYVFLENVPGVVSAGLGTITSDLASLGFDAEWGLLRASDVGAPHRRERFFLLAYTQGSGRDGWSGTSTQTRPETWDGSSVVADTASLRRKGTAVDTQRAPQISDTGFPPGPAGDWSRWDGPKPSVRRDTDGIPARLDRLHALGNAVVPQQVAEAYKQLSSRIS